MGGINNGHLCTEDDDCPGYHCNPDRDCCETDRNGLCKIHKVPDDNGVMVLGHGECQNVSEEVLRAPAIPVPAILGIAC